MNNLLTVYEQFINTKIKFFQKIDINKINLFRFYYFTYYIRFRKLQRLFLFNFIFIFISFHLFDFFRILIKHQKRFESSIQIFVALEQCN